MAEPYDADKAADNLMPDPTWEDIQAALLAAHAAGAADMRDRACRELRDRQHHTMETAERRGSTWWRTLSCAFGFAAIKVATLPLTPAPQEEGDATDDTTNDSR